MHTVLVAAAIVVEDGRVLLSQRKEGTHLAGKWEFPGGKVHPGEDPREGLRRELEEELGIDVVVGEVVDVAFHRYDGTSPACRGVVKRDGTSPACRGVVKHDDEDKAVLLLFFDAVRAPGSHDPRAIDVAAFAWAGPDELDPARFPPADIAVLRKVRAKLG
jgi:8-oxo-dGTP diphosphatase